MVVVMGVAGAGKTTVGQALAARLAWPFQEGDALHPPANIEKLRAGVPLTNADRAPWLAAIAGWIDERLAAGDSGVVACSALKRAYRDFLRRPEGSVRFAFLSGSRSVIAGRLGDRRNHFMPPALLSSQWADLEPPVAEEGVAMIGVEASVEGEVEAILRALDLRR